MSAITAPTMPTHRVLAVTRLHFVNIRSAFGMPWLIMGVILLLNIAIWATVYFNVDDADRADVSDGFSYSGSTSFIFVYMIVFAVQSIAVTFPFAQGYGVTRRNYWAGTALGYLLLSVGYAIGLTVLAGIEDLSHGWGFGGHMFTAVYFGQGPWFERPLVFFLILLASYFTGSMFAAIFLRWHATGLVTSFLVIAVVGVAIGAAVTASNAWSTVYDILVFAPPAGGGFSGLEYVWLLVPTALAALIGFLVLRRVTPKS